MFSQTILIALLLTVLSLATATVGSGAHRMNVHKGMRRSAHSERLRTQEFAQSEMATSTSQATPTSTTTATPSATSMASNASKWWLLPFPHFGNDHKGDGTYYEPGLGSCGKTNSDSDMIVAISHTMYDKKATSNPNDNPYCGKKIKATYEGKSVVVTVVDRCTGCKENDLDFSPAAFKKLAPMEKGRLQNVKWSFED